MAISIPDCYKGNPMLHLISRESFRNCFSLKMDFYLIINPYLFHYQITL
jgi:hypothetical protein